MTAYFSFRLLSAITTLAYWSSYSPNHRLPPLIYSPSSLLDSVSESELRSWFCSGQAKTPPLIYRLPVIYNCSPHVRFEDKKSCELMSIVLSSSENARGSALFISMSSSFPHCCLCLLFGTISSSSSNFDMVVLDGRNSCKLEGSTVGFTLKHTYVAGSHYCRPHRSLVDFAYSPLCLLCTQCHCILDSTSTRTWSCQIRGRAISEHTQDWTSEGNDRKRLESLYLWHALSLIRQISSIRDLLVNRIIPWCPNRIPFAAPYWLGWTGFHCTYVASYNNLF